MGSARTTASAAPVRTAPTSAVLRTPKGARSSPPISEPAVMPVLKAVDVPAAAMSELPGATIRTRAPRTADRAAIPTPAIATDGGGGAHAVTLELREAVYTVMLAELGVLDDARSALDVVVRRWADAAGRSSLALAPFDGSGDRLRVGTDPVLLVPDRLAHAAVDLVRELDVRQLKTCPLDEGGCGWLFLDRSRNGSRRWCSMDDCGARAKARRLTARRRSTRAQSSRG